jgi:hypothetical protein
MAKQHKVGTGLIGIQAELLQPTPEPLKIQLSQFFTHLPSTYSC